MRVAHSPHPLHGKDRWKEGSPASGRGGTFHRHPLPEVRGLPFCVLPAITRGHPAGLPSFVLGVTAADEPGDLGLSTAHFSEMLPLGACFLERQWKCLE